MRAIETTATVTPNGDLLVPLPAGVSPGQHRVVVVIEEQTGSATELLPLDLPAHDVGPWPAQVLLRREDLYGDHGR